VILGLVFVDIRIHDLAD